MSIRSQIFKHRWIILCALLVLITLVIDELIFSDQKRRVDPQTAITDNLHQQLAVLDAALQDISTRTITSENRLFTLLEKSETMPYFLFENGEIIYWSTNRFVPKYGTLSGTYLYKFLDIKSGQYIVKRKVVNSSNNRVIEIFALIPLVSNAKIADHFTESGMNAKVFGRSSYVLTAAGGASGAQTISSPEGIALFTYDGSPLMKIDYPVYDVLIFILYALCIVAFLMAGFSYAHRLAIEGGLAWATVVLALFFFCFRTLTLYYVFPLSIIDWSIFSPFAYADGFWQPSVGDLFVNVLSLWCVVFFVFNHFVNTKKHMSALALTSVGLGFVLLTWHFHYQLESMIVNGQWSFDITEELGFSVPKILGYLSVFISAMMPVMFLHLLLLQAEVSLYRQKLVRGLGLTALVGFLAFVFLGSTPFGQAALILIYAFLILVFGLTTQLSRLNYSSFLHLFLSCFIWSAMALLILNENVIKEERLNKAALAIDLRSENDITGEFLLDQARQRIEADILIQTNISNPFSPKDLIDQKIRRVYLGDYFDKYEIEIILFNGNGKAINANVLDLDILKEVYAIPENATEFEELYFLNDDFPQSLKQYYLFCAIRRYDTVIGHVLIKLDRKRQLNNSILPKLLLDEDSNEKRNDLSYAFFKDGELEEQNGTFNYRRDFDFVSFNEQLDLNDQVVTDGFTHTWFELNKEEVLVISSPVYPLAYKLTNFSIFFLFMIALIMTIFGLVSLLINSRKQQTTISTKVQILLNFAFFLPLITVSIVVLQLVNDTVEENLESKYLNTTRTAVENMVNPLYYFLTSRDMNSEEIENRIAEISQYAGADINLFNTSGQLIATNQRLIFENDLLAPFANPDAVASVIESSNVGELQLEQVGDITYKATYHAIIGGEEKELLGVLSMPFFDSQEELVEEQRQILSDILNAFTLIFVIFVLLSFLASRIITYPFTYLTKKIRATTLTKENEPLTWQADDEIGLLVREYNQMLVNLEKSKKALAQSEKESAWREMAQQVAHEIKNPLTPMKLKLQHLKRVLTTAEVDDADFEKPINNLLQQVEALSDIATSFSSFAKMPIPNNERVEINRILKRALGLFSGEEIRIQKEIPKEPIWVMADEQLLGRIFNNLILNAIQASEEQEHAKISVLMELKHRRVLVAVQDEGKGIPEEIRDKVFVPKFSTKKEGSGIGLAIAKRGVEHAGGSIWFESVEGEGTTFFIEFPIID